MNVTAVCPSTPCYFNAWIDWNSNGVFEGANGDHILNNYALNISGSHTYTIPFDIPTGGLPISGIPLDGTYYLRFRLYAADPGSNNLPNGQAVDSTGTTATVGEVEDYKWTVTNGNTTPVTISYFLAQKQGKNVNFSWSTATETGNVGFNLYAKSGTNLTLVNTQLIPSTVIDSLDRVDYSFSAQANGTAFYIEDVSVLGDTTRYGPFQIATAYGSRVEADKIDWAAIETEHSTSYANRQAVLEGQMSVPAAALNSGTGRALKPTKLANIPTKIYTPAPIKE